ncbi:hypothetical protein IRP63_14950 (plasmid) [Clostridium botulinum]|uniref:DUF5659 domain-containing protein n=2 Tax=Clostridium botulinum TaxID=1491 RepID=A0A9Q1ZB97_CLOBO|nr:DUF5659 domain-containing protein [Clostridium botulinum]AEB77410.1 hypothetical protein CbC4_4210 [Clostridium botulinum BKT015925]KEH96397.1 hypothetical protein Y848_14055 [Clostridium botulinum C/D str. Sp77]KEH96598.1 hypothetical protein Z953_p0182 [Clostridium botulinum D str. 16868]KGM93383.1 hypothetical protein Z955_15570 [Clostridium botulinum C/D str. DC5]KLU74500.1 hypothetical protein CBC3_p0208 [Clostridium botulinum V891]
MKTIAINSQRMAGWLMFNRFNLVRIESDKRDNSRNVYLFKDTQELRQCMNRYNEFKSMIDE